MPWSQGQLFRSKGIGTLQLKLTIYDDDKNILEECFLNPSVGNYGYHIPKGVWHGVEVLTRNTVMFEVKEGPYTPLSSEDILK